MPTLRVQIIGDSGVPIHDRDYILSDETLQRTVAALMTPTTRMRGPLPQSAKEALGKVLDEFVFGLRGKVAMIEQAVGSEQIAAEVAARIKPLRPLDIT